MKLKRDVAQRGFILATFATMFFSLAAVTSPRASGQATSPQASDSKAAKNQIEKRYLSGTRQLTFEGKRAGEGYFSPDGSLMVFQSERRADNPFFQI